MWVLSLSSQEVLRQRGCSSGPHRGQNDLDEASALFGQGECADRSLWMCQGWNRYLNITDHFLWCLASLLQLQADPRTSLRKCSCAQSYHTSTLGPGLPSCHSDPPYPASSWSGPGPGFWPAPGGLPLNPLTSAWGPLVRVPRGSVHSTLPLLMLPQSIFNQTAHTNPALLESARWERRRPVAPAQGWCGKCDLESPIS